MAFTITITPDAGTAVELFAAESISFDTQGNILQVPLPPADGVGAGASNAEIFDLLGAGTIITISGTLAENVSETTRVQFDNIDGLITGDQVESTFSVGDTLFADIKAMIASTSVTWTIPGFKASFTVKLFRGTRL